MYKWLIRKLFGTKRSDPKKLQPLVAAINELEPRTRELSDAALLAKTAEFKEKLGQGALDDLLIEAFAVVREVSRRTTKMRHFDVQLVGGAVLHQGKIAEMKTGEGKTLVATLPAYLNALEGRASTSSPSTTTWPSGTRNGWGRSSVSRPRVGTIQHEMNDPSASRLPCDITYGTNNEFGFDFSGTT